MNAIEQYAWLRRNYHDSVRTVTELCKNWFSENEERIKDNHHSRRIDYVGWEYPEFRTDMSTVVITYTVEEDGEDEFEEGLFHFYDIEVPVEEIIEKQTE